MVAMDSTSRPTKALLLAIPLITAGLAGCIGDPGSDLPWSSYDEAKAADGPVFEPNGTDSSVRVKWLQPQTPDNVPKGKSEIWLLLFDSEADEPIREAALSMNSYMPAMGHGTASEEDPTHQDFGVYQGVINPSMGGDWQLNLSVELSEGDTLDFTIDYTVEGEGGMDGDHGNETNDTDGNMSDGNQTDGNQTDGNQTANESEPEGFNGTFNDTMTATTSYEQSWTFPVNSTNFTVEATITLTATDPLAEVNLTIVDANGTEQGSVVVSEDGGNGTVTVDEPPTTGDWTATVTGQGVDASYELEVTVE